MTPIERITLYGIKHLIEREKWTPEIRKEMDKDLCDKIVEIVAPKQSEEPCCEMPEEESKSKFAVKVAKFVKARDEVNGICKCGHSKEIHRPDCEGIKPDSNQRKICGCQKFALNKENGK